MRELHVVLSVACLLAPLNAYAAPVTLTAVLTGANETAGGDAKASGGFKVTMDPETNDFCYSLWSDKPLKATMAHLHTGAAGVDGAPVVTLEVTGKASDECLAIEKSKLDPIVADPASFYVNIHTDAFPKGALRGQLTK